MLKRRDHYVAVVEFVPAGPAKICAGLSWAGIDPENERIAHYAWALTIGAEPSRNLP
jgi:hypothetical protein